MLNAVEHITLYALLPHSKTRSCNPWLRGIPVLGEQLKELDIQMIQKDTLTNGWLISTIIFHRRSSFTCKNLQFSYATSVYIVLLILIPLCWFILLFLVCAWIKDASPAQLAKCLGLDSSKMLLIHGQLSNWIVLLLWLFFDSSNSLESVPNKIYQI